MFEEKESFWRKKGFYLSACTLLVAVMAAGAIYYRSSSTRNSSGKLLADIATEVPDTDVKITASPDIGQQESTQTNAGVSNSTSPEDEVTVSPDNEAGTDSEAKKKAKKTTGNKKNAKKAETAGTDTAQKAAEDTQKDTVAASATQNQHSFDKAAGLLWPVEGDVILKYSMTNTVYFQTLAQYKCNPGIVISAKAGTNVKAAADCRVTKIEKDDELGVVVTTDIGDDFTVSYGQLDNISVNKGDELKEGDVIGTVAKPTKYYSVEGSNLFFQVKEGENTVDPLLLLR